MVQGKPRRCSNGRGAAPSCEACQAHGGLGRMKERMAKQGQEAMKKALQNARGAGAGIGLIAAAGAAVYGISQAMFT
ncbi:hypothetical protein ANCDUO_26021, partial [Ancylostoma duodenale]